MFKETDVGAYVGKTEALPVPQGRGLRQMGHCPSNRNQKSHLGVRFLAFSFCYTFIFTLYVRMQDEHLMVASDRSKSVTKLFKAVDDSIKSLNAKEVMAFSVSGGVVAAGAAVGTRIPLLKVSGLAHL